MFILGWIKHYGTQTAGIIDLNQSITLKKRNDQRVEHSFGNSMARMICEVSVICAKVFFVNK